MKTRLLGLAIATLGSLLIHQTALAATVLVQMSNFTFTPNNAQIKADDSVTWTNTVFTGHNTTSQASTPLWASSTFSVGGTFTHAFPSAGSFPYECTIHFLSNNMQGAVTVGNNPPPTITLSNPSFNQNGNFQFTLQGITTGKTNLIQASTTLTNWVTIATNTTASDLFTDITAPNFHFRFYRVVQLP